VYLFVTAVAGGAAFADVEGHGLTTWDGVWWAAAIMTTVGYGGLYPHTNGGRIIGILVMMVGIGFIAVLTAASHSGSSPALCTRKPNSLSGRYTPTSRPRRNCSSS